MPGPEVQHLELEARVQERTRELAEAHERLKALDRAKDEFLRLISHELRTPMTGVLGATDALADPSLDEHSRGSALEILRASVDRLPCEPLTPGGDLGLGPPVAAEVLRLSGGRVAVEGEARGMSFVVTLQAADAGTLPERGAGAGRRARASKLLDWCPGQYPESGEEASRLQGTHMASTRGSGLLAVALLAGCGGGGAGPTTPAGTTTTTFMGTSSVDAMGGCSSASRHDFSAGEGTIQVTLVQASAGAAGVQVCHPTAANHNTDCTIPPFASVALGGSVSAVLKGGRSQTVTVYPDSCGRTGTFAAAQLSYTVSLTYPR